MSTTVIDRVRAVTLPILEAAGVDLYDLEYVGSTVRVLVDSAGGSVPSRPVDLDLLARLTREISRALDREDPVAGRYTLEVSTPGLERPLRTEAHLRGAVGTTVTIKTTPAFEGPRRLTGRLHEVRGGPGATALVIVLDEPAGGLDAGAEVEVPHDRVDKARTTFDWGPTPKPGGPRPRRGRTATDAPRQQPDASQKEVDGA
jgi:ribosome maturation factor RimP